MKVRLSPPLEQFLDAFVARRIRFGAFVLIVAALAAAIALVLPSWYRAESTLLPPPEDSDASGSIAGLIQSSALASVGLVTTSSTSDVFVEILRSRTIQSAAIRRFDLEKTYGRRGMDRTLSEFRRHLNVTADRSGIVQLKFEDRDPERAAQITNYMVSELDRFNREVYSTRAKRTRQFLEERLEDTRKRLSDASERLSEYEKTHRVIASQEQASVQGGASVMAEKFNLQIRRAYVSEYADPSSPLLREIDAQLSALEREIGRLPGLKMEGARLSLDVEVQSRLFTLVSSQYEEARIQETRDTPTVTVLDAAQPPEIRVRPKRTMIVLASVVAAFLLCVLYTMAEIRSRAFA